MSSPTVAVIGVGAMGGPLALHLIERGLSVWAYDADSTKVDAIVEAGGTRLSDLGSVRRVADWIVLSLPGPAEVAATVDQILAGGGDVTRGILDLTSSEPSTSRELHGQAARSSLRYLDAGVLGNPPLARTGSLILLLGGGGDEIDWYGEILELVSRSQFALGTPGAGHAAKLAANELFTAQVAAMAEALTVLDGIDADTTVFLDAIASTGGRGVGLSDIGRTMIGDPPPAGFALRLAAKDVRLLSELATELNLDLPVVTGLASLYGAAAEATPAEDYTRVYQHLTGRGAQASE
ncbi:NAD(P)-dependent oxidoreductase [Agreia sp. Leaf335]|uniref:NAD(P)-dependent oxidoreductase n=1 Tax=Agreia sp. Leaf335 TaxID=1736340 RepID=UPI0009E91B96|nr:NAD(P)-binding domain-containing protein [Agreia sp. Leaf335]